MRCPLCLGWLRYPVCPQCPQYLQCHDCVTSEPMTNTFELEANCRTQNGSKIINTCANGGAERPTDRLPVFLYIILMPFLFLPEMRGRFQCCLNPVVLRVGVQSGGPSPPSRGPFKKNSPPVLVGHKKSLHSRHFLFLTFCNQIKFV